MASASASARVAGFAAATSLLELQGSTHTQLLTQTGRKKPTGNKTKSGSKQ
jgi:hypothetical protein